MSALKSEDVMRSALRYAQRGEGRVAPNPSVGAIVYKGSRVLGRGTTKPPGGPHAEVVAIANARRRHGPRALRGASLAVTLEPCCHVGRTGPCTDAIIEAGVTRVAVGLRDPHPLVAGGGLRKLRRAGIEVEVGVLGEESRRQHKAFLSSCLRGRPWVVLKLAATLDGRIATAAGESRWITGAESRAFVHGLRAHVDAVLVGSGTVMADDPALTARRGTGIVHRPVRVLVDRALSVPTERRIFCDRNAPTWVLCAEHARGQRARRDAGARVLECQRERRSGVRGPLDLEAAMQRLGKEGLTHLLVEGGGELAAALLRKRLVDELHWFVAPRLLGGDGRAALGALEVAALAGAPSLRDVTWRRRGKDLHLHAWLSDLPGKPTRRRA